MPLISVITRAAGSLSRLNQKYLEDCPGNIPAQLQKVAILGAARDILM
jgi:hypothetical protein